MQIVIIGWLEVFCQEAGQTEGLGSLEWVLIVGIIIQQTLL